MLQPDHGHDFERAIGSMRATIERIEQLLGIADPTDDELLDTTQSALEVGDLLGEV